LDRKENEIWGHTGSYSFKKKLVVDKMITEIIPLDSYQTIYGG
jgi:hypothetical protein